MKNVSYFAAEAKLQLLGKHCFLPSSVNRMIRMSKDEEMGKKKKEQCIRRESSKSKPK